MEKNMEVDVILPMYNAEKYILQALQSVFAQSYKPKQVFIVDDGSTDSSEKVVKSYLEQNQLPISYIKKENGGPNSARNAGLKACTSKYVAFLDADDEWVANKLEKQLDIFKRNAGKNLGLVYTDYQEISSDGGIVSQKTHTSPTLHGQVFEKLLRSNQISGSASAVLIKRECFDTVGLFDETLRNGEDWDMWLRLAEKYEFDFVSEKLVKIRIHPENSQKDTAKMLKSEIIFYNKWTQLLADSGRIHSVPKVWPLRLLKKIIMRLPHFDFIAITRKNLTKETAHIFIKKLYAS